MSKRAIIIISIVSALIFIAGTTAVGVIFVKKIGPIIQNNMRNLQIEEERTPEEALDGLAEKYKALDWTVGLKTVYSFEIKDKAEELEGKRIVFIATLYDIIKSEGNYYAVMSDRNINASFSIIYRRRCTQDLLNRLTAAGEKEDEDTYMVYACAATIEKAAEGPEEDDYWTPSLIMKGTLVDFEGIVQQGYDEY